MNYIFWQYTFIIFLIASVLFVCLTIIFSFKYKLIALIRSILALRKDEKKLQNNAYSVDKIINEEQAYNSDSSDYIKQIDDDVNEEQMSENQSVTNTTAANNENESTELIHATEIPQSLTGVAGLSDEGDNLNGTVIVNRENTGTVIVSGSNNSSSKNKDLNSFIMIKNILVINGNTDEIKKYR